MLDQPFYDDVHRWTFATRTPMHRVAGPHDAELLNYRRLIRTAQRFVIDDDLLEHLVHLSNTPDQDQFHYWSILARLPYDVMWIEWDQLVRLQMSQQLGKLSFEVVPEEISRNHGMLMVRDLTATAKWVAYSFAQMSDGETFINPLVLVFDPDGEPFEAPLASHDQALVKLSESGLKPVSALGEPPLNQRLGIRAGLEYVAMGYLAPGGRTYGTPNWAVNKIGLLEEPIWRKFRNNRLLLGDKPEDTHKPYIDQAYENRGLIRTVVALLALINNVPRTIRGVAPRAGYRPMRANRVPYLGHNTITLTLPKTRQLAYIQQRLRLGYGRYRRHDVRGFYRRVTNDRVGIRCHHIPTPESTSDHITCARCGSQIRWVHEFQRGDASLGHVQKNYRLKAPSC